MYVIYSHHCPKCKTEDAFQFHRKHHKENTPYNWVCATCGAHCTLEFYYGGSEIKNCSITDITPRSVTLIELRADTPIFLVCNSLTTLPVDLEKVRWFYEEHTCPSNTLRSTIEVVAEGKVDQHGICEFVDHVVLAGTSPSEKDKAVQVLTDIAVARTAKVPPKVPYLDYFKIANFAAEHQLGYNYVCRMVRGFFRDTPLQENPT